MNDSEYLRGHCDHCGGEIEFPATASGQTTACPLCGQNTALVAGTTTPPAEAQPARRGGNRAVMFAILGVVSLGAAGIVLFSRTTTPGSVPEPPAGNSNNAATPSTTASASKADTNSTAASPAKPRSPDDLKAGPISLEKARNSSLVHAVGVLRNESDHQRFGVTVEVELTDARGNDAGTAKDYRAVIEPRQEWRFRALVLNSKASEGRVARIREE